MNSKTHHRIVNRATWKQERVDLLNKEKEFTKQRDELAAQRRALPWVLVDKEYQFDSVDGLVDFKDIFEDKSQLVIYHFMFGPDWETGCKSCSFWADNFNGITTHLKARDTTLGAISRTSMEKIRLFKDRMGWSFPWYSSFANTFNFDFHVSLEGGEPGEYNYKKAQTNQPSEWPGISVFYKDEADQIYHTYSCFARELETYNTVYRYLDIAPKGRNENGLPYGQAWVRLRDEY